jgi:L-glyceraldehyde 3-phosphate reductase
LDQIPIDSRAGKSVGDLHREEIEEARVKVRRLNEIAQQRGQSLAQMAIAWVLRRPEITSAVFGASQPQQVQDIVGALKYQHFSLDELVAIDACLS